MRLDALFRSVRGNDLDRNTLVEVEPPDGVNYVTRVGGNNGVSGRVLLPPDIIAHPGGVLTVALGSRNYALATFLQPEPFVTGQNIQVLVPKNLDMPPLEKLWWAACITENRFRFGRGRYANRTLDSLELPDEVPEWVVSQESESRELLEGPTPDPFTSGPPLELTSIAGQWSDFRIGDIFDVRKGSRLTKRQRIPGTTIYVGTAKINNGWVDMISAVPKFPPLSITVPYNGNIGYALLQPVPFCASDDVHVLIPRTPVGVGALLFVCAVIRSERYRFAYGRKWNLDRMVRSTLHLPTDSQAEPNWEAMQRFVASRPFSRVAFGSTGDGIDSASVLR
jgi:Type I restriction modification DNA specificity domain